MPAGPLQLMMAPFPEGFSGDLDQQWQQGVQLLEGNVVTSTLGTPQKLWFAFDVPWPVGFKGTLDQTWAMGVSLMKVYASVSGVLIPLSIAPFPDGFQGTLNETWQQALKLITGLVP